MVASVPFQPLICFDKTLMQRGESDATAEQCLGRGRPLFGPVSFPSLGPSWFTNWILSMSMIWVSKKFPVFWNVVDDFPKFYYNNHVEFVEPISSALSCADFQSPKERMSAGE